MIDLLISNASVITVDPQRRVFREGAIAIQGSKILEVGRADTLAAKYPAETVIDGTGMIAMPGMINCHMHLPQVLMRGVNDNTNVMSILKDNIWPIQGNYNEEDALISARLGFLEMIKSGTTAFLGTGMHPRYGIDAIAQNLLDSGMRGVLSKYVMDVTGYAKDESALHRGVWENSADALRQAKELIDRWHGAGNGRLQIWYSPRSVGGVSKELFIEISRLALERGVGITTHWAEVQNNVDYTLDRYGCLPIEFAAQVGMLGKHVTFAHGICLTDREIDILAETGTNICHCPVCNAKLAMGAAKVPQMLHKGVNVCLGNDGMPVNNTADMFREMRSAMLLQRVTFGDPCYPTAAQAIEMATINGAKGIMADHLVGSLEAGKQADIVLINARSAHITPLHDPVSAVAWAANGSDVDTVLIDGRVVMRGRTMMTLDEEQILNDAEDRKDKILKQAGIKPNYTWPLL